ncbi:hypothetical protein BH11PAT1_BH11PAT1_3420 [soil metagenome]
MDSTSIKDKIKSHFRRLRYSYRHIPDKKVYLEFFTGILSIPVLLTVIVLNVNNLKNNKSETKVTPTPEKQIIYLSPTEKSNTSATPTPSAECKKGIAPISIGSPDEGDSVNDNPVNILINYQQGVYCSVVWAYRINNGTWSGYDDKSIALYNLPNGQVKFDLKVKSIVSSDEKQLRRTFTYTGSQVALSPAPQASGSAQ